MNQPDLFGGEGNSKPDPYRTEAGKLRVSTKKAIAWYVIEHGLKVTAASAYPQIFFLDAEGNEVKANITDIVSAYDDFKKKTHGRKVAA